MTTLDLSSLAVPLSLRPAIALTDEELMSFAAINKPYRFERNRQGEIVMMSPVGGVGGTHEAYIGWALYQWNELAGTGVAFMANTGFNLPDGSCLSPDAAWLSLARWEGLSPDKQAGFPPLCPEFVIEVRSQSDQRRMVEEKMQLWLDNGAELAWLVDPVDQSVTIYSPTAAPVTMHRPETIRASHPVLGFSGNTTRLWLKP